MTEKEQQILIRRSKEGDKNAFEELVKMYEERLFAFALSVTGGNYEISADIFQEALLKAYLYIKSFKDGSSFSTWLWKIVKNEYINYLKSPRTISHYNTPNIDEVEKDKSISAEDSLMRDEDKMNLLNLIGKLSLKEQEIITLIELNEMSHLEAAEFLGIKVGAVKVRIHRAREKLFALVLNVEELFK